MTAAIKINQNDGKTRNVMTGGETEVDFDFPIFAATHLAVYETDTAGDITLLVKDTDYTVPVGSVGVQAGGTIDLDATQYPSGATAGHIFTVYQNAPESRTTDFNQAGDFFADTLNQELDLITQQIQQLRRDLARAPLAPVDTTLTTLTMPDPQDGYGFVWDGVAGAIRNTTSSLASLEGDAETVAGIAAAVTAVAAIDTEVATVAGITANVTTAAGIAANITTVAGISANVTTVAGISANVTTVAGDSADIQLLAPITADIQTLADIEDGTVATGAIQAVAAIDTDVTAVAAIAANVSAVAAIDMDVTAVAGITADVTTVAGIASDVSIVAGIAADVTAAANNIPQANRTATTDPTVNDDSGDGYSEGSLWVNTATNTIYLCSDPAAGAAVWQSLAGALSGLSDATITGIANNDFLVYDTGTNTWENKTAANARTAMGLGNGVTYDIASQAEAEAGTATDKLLTPERVAQAIAALAAPNGTLLGVQLLTGSGTYTATSGATKAVAIAIGAGGGGGGADPASTGFEASAGGGGGGGCAIALFTISGTVSYSCGAAGAAGSSTGGNGGTGGTTTLTGIAVASGGTGGAGTGTGAADSKSAAGGAAGAGSTGTILLGGGDGGNGMTSNDSARGGSGGQAAGIGGGGGAGGSTEHGGGAQFASTAGNDYGGGGGGAGVSFGTGTAGQPGAAGAIYVFEFK